MKTTLIVFTLLMRILLAAVFLWAGFAKFLQPEAFVVAVTRFQILPASLVVPFALALPIFEILSALALLAGPWKREAAFNCLVLCVLFLAALAAAWLRGIEIECSCFGGISPESLPQIVLRDLLLLAAAIHVYLYSGRENESLRPLQTKWRSLRGSKT